MRGSVTATFQQKKSRKSSTGYVGQSLIFYTVFGIVLVSVGAALLRVKGRVIPLVEEVTVSLMCPSCQNKWEEPLAKSLLEAMGYPRVRSLPRRRCSKCGRFIRPKIVAVGGGALSGKPKEKGAERSKRTREAEKGAEA